MVIRAYLLAAVAVLALVAPEVWYGLRLATFDPMQSVIAPTEQPLSVRSSAGPWAMVLALSWFSLAYWRHDVKLWEPILVVIGGAVALVRVGNLWLDAIVLIMPFGRQLSLLDLRPAQSGVLTALGVMIALVTLVQTRPIALPEGARAAALGTTQSGTMLADWRWAPDVRRGVGQARTVLAGGGLASESPQFWADYVRIAQGHERWAELLQGMGVNLLVLDAADQQRPAADLVRTSADWRVTFDADGALVAERRSSP